MAAGRDFDALSASTAARFGHDPNGKGLTPAFGHGVSMGAGPNCKGLTPDVREVP
jgi:hypothetical protein